MKRFFGMPSSKDVLWTLSVILFMLIIFGLGVMVGYRRAVFSYEFGMNHDRYAEFGSHPFMGMWPLEPGAHGIVGKIKDVADRSITIKDSNGHIFSILVSSSTVIRSNQSMIKIENIGIGDMVTIIGEPLDNGQVEARFIRVFASILRSSSSPQ